MAFGDNPVYYICDYCGGEGVVEIDGGFTVGLGPEGLVPTYRRKMGSVDSWIDYSIGLGSEGLETSLL